MKFGGASVATPEHFPIIAQIISCRLARYSNIAVVISAMGDTTDQLIQLAKRVHPTPPEREYDMLVSVGERISIALLAMALAIENIQGISFTGSQSGIITCSRHSDARIADVRPHRILQAFSSGKIAIVAGFQGMSREGEITTLGRGGSDTTAVALGIALRAEKVEFFKDVDGIYLEDPKKIRSQAPYPHLDYAEALAIASRGAKVLHARSISLAARNKIPLEVRSYTTDPNAPCGTVINDYGIDGRSTSFHTLGNSSPHYEFD